MEYAPQPCFVLSASSILCYDQYQGSGHKHRDNRLNMQNLTRGVFKGQMSENTRKDLRKKLCTYYDSMYNVGQFYRKRNKIVHPIVTLTLPAEQLHCDNVIKKECLSRWVELAVAKYDIKYYYWVAEKKENERLHLHVLADRFMEKEWVRKSWNQRLASLGYLDRFESKFGHREPPSTDIQQIHSLAKSSDYVTKYTSKAEQNGFICGRLHGECDLLKECKKYGEERSVEMEEKLSQLVSMGVLRDFSGEKYRVFNGDIRKVMKEHMPYTYARWLDYSREIANLFYG